MKSEGIANVDIAEVRKRCDVDRGLLDEVGGEKEGERVEKRSESWREGGEKEGERERGIE